MNRLLLILFTFVFFSLTLSGHPWKPQHYVIVDTDCGIDDFRAICMLLASSDVRVLAITTSDGVLDAKTGYYKVKCLLNDLHHEGILVGTNSDAKLKVAACLPALQMEWGKPIQTEIKFSSAIDIINYVLENTHDKITFISLGSLNTVRLCTDKCPKFSQKISRILWSSQFNYDADNFNYNLDKNSASRVMAGETPVSLIYRGYLTHYNDQLLNNIAHIGTDCADKIEKSLISCESQFEKTIYDEAVVLYLHYPAFFNADTTGTLIRNQLSGTTTENNIDVFYNKILLGETTNQNQVLTMFPMDTAAYFADVQSSMLTSLARFGKEEWVANVLANELHRHLGVYAVIGVKMGVRAKEYFGAGIDELSIISYAGLTPPFSCLNDGLQVSTGATLGHGLIQVGPDTIRLPQAEFTYMNRRIKLLLKPEYQSMVESEIRELSKIYGLDSNIYWELVRRAAIKYWANLDRNEMFTIIVL